MFKKTKPVGHPILAGQAVVAVRLAENEKEESFLDRLFDSIQLKIIRKQVNSFYHGAVHLDNIPFVKLRNFNQAEDCEIEELELDMGRDRPPQLQFLKRAFSSLMTLGVLTISFLMFSGSNGKGSAKDADTNSIYNNPIKRDVEDSDNNNRAPVIVVRTDKEKSLLASLTSPEIRPSPAQRHYFRLGGHQNISHTDLPATLHSNTGGETPHNNVLTPHGDHTNHANYAHTNHTNTHSDNAYTVYSNSHSNDASHGNHSNSHNNNPATHSNAQS